MKPEDIVRTLVIYHPVFDVLNCWTPFYQKGDPRSGANIVDLLQDGWQVIGIL